MSSFEIVGMGPMDRHESTMVQAAKIQSDAMVEALTDPEKYIEFRHQIAKLDEQTPLEDEEVRIIGRQLTFALDEDGGQILALPGGSALMTETGTYQGYDLIPVYNPATDSGVLRAINILKTGETLMHEPLGDIVVRHHRSLFCVEDSEVMPLEPVHAHRYRDIKDDPLIASLGGILLNPHVKRLKKLHVLAEMVNQDVAQNPYDETRHHIRMSYFNSLNLLEDVTLTARRAFRAKVDTDGTANIKLHLNPTKYRPDILRLRDKYNFDSATNEGEMTSGKEVYAEGYHSDGAMISATLKDIIEVS